MEEESLKDVNNTIMGINRFYTPYLPEYTSQFVEKDVGDMLDLMELKAKRDERAYALKDETDALLQSIQPGYRTTQMAPQVQQYYKGKINEYMQKHESNMSSVAAIGDLTKLRSEFRADPNVSLIKQDREANDYWDRMRTREDYDIQTDPNVDPTTGQPRQFEPGQSFENYNTPIFRSDYDKMINEAYKQIEPDISYGNSYVEDVKDEAGNVVARQIVRPRYSRVSDEKLDPVRANLANRLANDQGQPSQYFRAKFQGEPTEENINAYLRGKYEEPYRRVQSVATYSSPISAGPEEEEAPTSQPTYGGLNRPVFPTNNKGINVKEDLSSRKESRAAKSITNTDEKVDDLWLDLASDNTGLVPPETLFGNRTVEYEGETINPFGKRGEMTSYRNIKKAVKGVMFNNLDNNYFKTVDDYIGEDGYYNRYKTREEFNEAKDNGEIDGLWGDYKDLKEQITNAVAEYDKVMEFDNAETEILSTDLTKNQAYYAVLSSGIFDTAENTPFDVNGKDPVQRSITFKNSDVEDWNTQQRTWASKMTKAYLKDASNTIINPDYEEITEGERKNIEQAFVGKTTPGNAVIKNGAMTEHLKDARWIPVDIVSDNKIAKQLKKGDIKSLTVEQKRDIIMANQGTTSTGKPSGETVVNINGRYPDDEMAPGSGYYSVTIGQDTWMIQGSQEEVEAGRLQNNIFSYEFTENVGNGNVFALDYYDPSKPLRIIDIHNQDKIGESERAIWMQTIKDEQDGSVKLLIYNTNPNSIEKPKKDVDYTEWKLFSTYGGAVDPEDMEMKTVGMYFMALADRLSEAYRQSGNPDLKVAADESLRNYMKVYSLYPHLFNEMGPTEE